MDEKDPQDLAAEESLVARLRAADPAHDAAPDTPALRADVDARRADEPATQPADELAVRRSRRWSAWPAKVAGVAAAALLVGGGGYAIGAAGDGASGSDSMADGGAAPAMTLQQPKAGGAESADTTASDAAPALSPSAIRGGGVSDSAYWGGWGGRTVFTASGLSEDGSTLHAWAFDPTSSFTEQTVTTAAAALGVTGTPQLQDGSWTVGPTDGTGPMVQIYADGTGSLSYWDPGKDPWYCPTTTVGVAPGADSKAAEADPSSDVVAPEPNPCEERDLGPAPQGDAATQVVRDLLTALGKDPATYEIVAENYGDESQAYAYVTAYQVLEGQRTGLTWSATLTGAGIQSFYGSTAPLVDIGEYDVVSPTEAVARLSDPRFGSGSYGPLYYADGASAPRVAVDGPASTTPTVPPTVGAGSRISWPVAQATIVEARLGLAMNTQADGATLLVPTYELVGDDGAVWSVIAVADAQLDFSATS